MRISMIITEAKRILDSLPPIPEPGLLAIFNMNLRVRDIWLRHQPRRVGQKAVDL